MPLDELPVRRDALILLVYSMSCVGSWLLGVCHLHEGSENPYPDLKESPASIIYRPQVVYILANPTIKALEDDLRIEKAKLDKLMDRKHARLFRRERSLKEKQNLQRQQDKELQKESRALEKEMRLARNSWMKMKDRALSWSLTNVVEFWR